MAENQTLFPSEENSPIVVPLPYGMFDLEPVLQTQPGPTALKVKCVVRGCNQFLLPPARTYRGEYCKHHHIRVHQSATFSYRDVRRNFITAQELLATRIVGHPFKFESHRLASERSEDALTFNVMRSFQEAKILHLIGRYVTGLDTDEEPRLFLWGLELTDDSLIPFDLLIAARQRFESRLPIRRPATEPDAMLYLPGQYLILCEAKFGSENPVNLPGHRKTPQSLTMEELIDIYSDPQLPILDMEKAWDAEFLYGQLWRNLQFAAWMAMTDGQGTDAYLVSLTRAGYENQSCNRFSHLIRPEFADRFCHMYWEDLYVLAGLHWRRMTRLQHYLMTKTSNLVRAFRLGV